MEALSVKKTKWLKTAKWLYWINTGLIAALMLSGGISYFFNVPQTLEGMAHLGYPAYLLKILGTAKILGSLALLYGKVATLKEWAYAGFTFNLLGAAASHAFSGDPLSQIAAPVVICGLLLVSYRQWKTGWM